MANPAKRSFFMAKVMRCKNPCCTCVHFACPFCDNLASVEKHKVTEFFSVVCDENPNNVFLVERDALFQ